jgi:hypothetical protein
VASYKVVFLGLFVIGHEEESRLLKGLQKKFNITPERAESMLQRVPIVVKKGISKEEADRYIKAFEEIGGKVKVEEEEEDIPRIDITQSYEPKSETNPQRGSEASPTVPRRPEIERRPFKGQMVTCPQCGFEQPETDECVKCGIIISKYRQYQEMAKSVEGQVKEISSEEYTPWESGEGFFQGLYRTVIESLFSPVQFYKKIAAGKGYWNPFIFAMIIGIIGAGIGLIWQVVSVSKMISPEIAGVIPYTMMVIILIVALPFVIAFSVAAMTIVTHIFLMILGGNKKGFEATFRAIAYSFSSHLWYIIPFLGALVGTVYMIVLAIIGVRETHATSTGRAVFAVLLPPVLVIVFAIFAAVLIPLYMVSRGVAGVPQP